MKHLQRNPKKNIVHSLDILFQLFSPSTFFEKMLKLKLKLNFNFNFNFNMQLQLAPAKKYFSLKVYDVSFSNLSSECSNTSWFKSYEFLKNRVKIHQKMVATGRPELSALGFNP
jgi:hypothetical protein